jgi:hypothetical protein
MPVLGTAVTAGLMEPDGEVHPVTSRRMSRIVRDAGIA